MNQIKLVIWDLDDTFWTGTLSEGEIQINRENIELVKSLSQNGIINSICSKNDPERVKQKLKEVNIYEHFVFASVDWSSKGPRLKSQIQTMGLREENVVFIDDNHHNREEAKYFCPKLTVIEPQDASNLLNEAIRRSRKDPNCERLRQYQELEIRSKHRVENNQTTDEFLKSSEITISILPRPISFAQRIHELIERSNQLNFTKKRVDYNNTIFAIKNSQESAAIFAKDKYGDFGLIGFYAKNDGLLEHFVFSCRILNMGIERHVYKSLHKPRIEIKQPVSANLDQESDTSYIRIVELNEESRKSNSNLEESQSVRSQILLVGGCDLDQVAHYLGSHRIKTEFNYVDVRGISIHREHSQFIRQSFDQKNEMIRAVRDFPVFNESDIEFESLYSKEWDVFIYSPLNDYSRGLYRHNHTGVEIPFELYTHNIIEMGQAIRKSKPHLKHLKDEWLKSLESNYSFVGGISPSQFYDNIKWISSVVAQGRTMVILTGSEYNPKIIPPYEQEMQGRHIELNRQVKRLTEEGVVLSIDVNKFIDSEADIGDNIRHYQPKVYYKIAQEIEAKYINKNQSISLENNIKQHAVLIREKIKRKIDSIRKKIR